ncbi:glycoside hydrolase family 1 protein [Clostridium vincentii]|uniref:6-phospho-beta-glucosidase GmuD n=1 Tax=Clostridium vincentii TaxID=52704 RepID=A0A2T0BIC9_9CLOT|nr:glycoside hydrolase family 1 protein [Clostridium vincentii]PRR83603.1 6-phospho-beta-glucosidase GmuD [Clostridium vincentii]
MRTYTIPKTFTLGAAVWAQGTEGAYNEDEKSLTVMEQFALDEPNRMQGGIGPFETLNWYHDYKKYVDIMSEMGLESFRTSITWARLIPDGENVNEKAIEFYRNYFKYIKGKGIKLWVVLYWFDMPVYLENIGGFSNRKVVDSFVRYSKKAIELFNEYVDIFYVYNEPGVDLMFKYQEEMCYPNEVDFDKSCQAQYNMIVAHGMVVNEFKKLGLNNCKIGSVVDVKYIYPRSKNIFDLKAKRYFEILQEEAWLYPLILGKFSDELFQIYKEHKINIDMEDGDLEIIQNNTISVLGINNYFPERVKAKESIPNPNAPLTMHTFYDNHIMHGRRMNLFRGWEIYPQSIYDTLMKIKEKYNNIECYITENGMGVQEEERFRGKDGVIQDDYRIEYVTEHLESCIKALNDGSNLKGYHMWSFIDLWSPSNQFLNCYGFVEYNLITKESKLKKSASWYKELIITRSLKCTD